MKEKLKISKLPFSRFSVRNAVIEIFVSATTTLPKKDGGEEEYQKNIPVKISISASNNFVDILEGLGKLDQRTVKMIRQALQPTIQIAQKSLECVQNPEKQQQRRNKRLAKKSEKESRKKQLPLF
jgi:hypothetical protein